MNKVYPFIYTAKTFDINFDTKPQMARGICFAETFSDAAYIVESYYDDILCDLHLEPQEESPLLEINEDTISLLMPQE